MKQYVVLTDNQILNLETRINERAKYGWAAVSMNTVLDHKGYEKHYVLLELDKDLE